MGMTCEESLEELDMVHTVCSKQSDVAVKEHWFSMAVNSTVNTRQTASLLNLLKPRSNLEVRVNFFSVRVVDVWTAILSEKNGMEPRAI